MKLREKVLQYFPKQYKANRLNEQWEVVSSHLIKILSEQRLWQWNIWAVDRVKVGFKWKKLDFATKDFHEEKFVGTALEMYKKVKQAWLPTWTTYRHLEGTNKVLMSLGNADGSLIFSYNNTSRDRISALEHQDDIVANKEHIFEQAINCIDKLSKHNLKGDDDCYFLKIKDKKVSLIIGDFDLIKEFPEGTQLAKRKEKNIAEFSNMLRILQSSFKDIFTHTDFLDYLKEKQKQWDHRLEGVHLE